MLNKINNLRESKAASLEGKYRNLRKSQIYLVNGLKSSGKKFLLTCLIFLPQED